MSQLAHSGYIASSYRQAGPGTSPAQSGVTELVLSHESPDLANLLLPMLAFLSNQRDAAHQNRWITWVAPQGIDKALLQQYGVDTGKIRLIHISKPEDILWITWEALAAGNSHTVIASPGKLSEKELRQLEAAAHQGQTQGLLLRFR